MVNWMLLSMIRLKHFPESADSLLDMPLTGITPVQPDSYEK
jgi:hypothetical protein